MSSTSSSPSTPSQAPASEADLSTETIDASCRWPLLALLAAGALWLVVSALLGLIASIKFHGPNFLADSAWLTYGRVRPAATNALIYGFCIPVAIGIGAWMLARLGRTVLAAPIAFVAGVKLWNIGVAVGLYGILTGDATGFEVIDMPRYALGVLFAAYLLLGVPAVLTLHRRTVRPLFVSQWFFLAALFWFPWIFSTAALLVPGNYLRGVVQPIIAWWYAANLQTVWFGLTGLALAFYFIPKLTNRELCSHNKALFAFWVLILFGSWTGIPTSAPLPAWIPALSTVMTWMTLLTAITVPLIVLGTVNGRLSALWISPETKFLLVALLAFVGANVMNIVDATPGLNQNTLLTWFAAAKWQLGVYGFFAMVLFASVYFVLPRVAGVTLPFPKFAGLHFWLAAGGTILMVLPWLAAGIIQGAKLQNPNFAFVDIARGSLMALRLSTVGDLLLLMGHLLLVANVFALILGLVRRNVRTFTTEATAPLQTVGVKP